MPYQQLPQLKPTDLLNVYLYRSLYGSKLIGDSLRTIARRLSPAYEPVWKRPNHSERAPGRDNGIYAKYQGPITGS